MATTDLARTEGLVTTFDEAARAAKAMAQSGYFTDAREASQAMVKILAGVEMGFGPFASMSGIHVIQGKPAVGANLMAAAVKGHPRYDYRVLKMADDAVEIEYLQDGESIGVSAFSAADATRAGTKNMGKFPRNMLFARAMSNGVRWFCPDVFAGNAVYTPDELGEVVDGTVVEIEPSVVEAKPSAKTPADREQTPETPAVQDSAPNGEYPTGSWVDFRDYAVQNLQHYTSGEHVVNALRQAVGGGDYEPWKGWTPERAHESWVMLTGRLEDDGDDNEIPF